LPIWDGSIVPLGQEIIKDDPHIFHGIGSYLAASLIDFVNDMNESGQAGAGVGFFHQFFDQFKRCKNHALAGTGDMGEEAVFDGVVLGTIGWVMGDADFDPQFIGESLEISLEEMMTGTVTAATVTKHQDGSGIGVFVVAIGIPPVAETIAGEFTGVVADTELDVANVEIQIVEIVGDDDPFRKTGEVMVIGLEFIQFATLTTFPIPIEQVIEFSFLNL